MLSFSLFPRGGAHTMWLRRRRAEFLRQQAEADDSGIGEDASSSSSDPGNEAANEDLAAEGRVAPWPVERPMPALRFIGFPG